MIVPEQAILEHIELLNLEEITESGEGDSLFFITCSKKLEEQIWEKYVSIQNLFGFPKFGSC